MMSYNSDSTQKKIIRVCKDSGCFLANYSTPANDEDSVVVLYEENNEKSGKFKLLNKYPNKPKLN